MRVRAYVLSGILLFAVPSLAAASQITFFEFLNSDLTFGTVAPDQFGRDLSAVDVDGHTPSSPGLLGATWRANAGALVKQTLKKDGNGDVVGSTYVYGPGTFSMDFGVGSFEAPIESLTIEADEGPDGSVSANYVLGPGLFDTALANELGIGRHSLGGSVFSGLELTDHGNRPGVGGTASTSERQAWDGFADVSIPVPEPAATTLLLAGVAAAVTRFRKRVD